MEEEEIGDAVPVKPYYQDDKKGRTVMRISLGDKEDKNGEFVQAEFYLSTVLGWARHVAWGNKKVHFPFDDFVAQGWQGDHLIDLQSEDLVAPESAFAFLF